nr:S8 family serine peptidase [Ignavibacteriaceae bacterium]
MKNLLLLIITVALFSSNNFAQYNFSTFNNKKSTDNLDKMINAEIKYADNLSSKKSPILNIVLDKILDDNGNYNKTSEAINQYRDIMYFYIDAQNILTIPVFIKTSSLESTKNKILELGGFIGTVAGDVVTAHVPASSINFIAESPDVIYIDASTVSETKLDLSRIETKVNQLHNGTGIQRPYKGNGIVVGVVDSGIDWKHQDFKNSGGNRIKYLWDMSGSGNPPSGYSYGTEYTKAQLDANQCQEIDGDDGHGHGTHVTGTAAGNGGANSSYVGMAPESDIIFVKGFRNGPGFSSTDVVDGCNYIFQKSQQLGKPSVINLSLGGHFSPHDGSSLYEQALSNLTGNGKIIVAAAGNEGGNTIHLSYTTTGSSFNDSYETYFELYNNASSVYADMWYSGGNISVGLAAYDNSLNLIGYTNAVTPGQKIENLAFTVSGNTYGYVTIDATGVNNPNNGANEVVVVIDSQNGQVNINNVFWSLYTYGTGTFDAWAVGHGAFSTYVGQSWLKPGDDQKTIGAPGTSNKIVCVGSYVTKNQWVDVNGTTQYQPGNPVIGQISNFSSMGPTRDGRLKPDIVAPGEVIVAAYSSFLTQTPATDIILGGKHQKMQGTSMASPHVTGSVALLLEKNGTLNYDQVVAILKNNAKHDSYTGSSPNNIYGHGKLDAYNSFLNTTGGGGGAQTANLVYDDGTPSGGYVW